MFCVYQFLEQVNDNFEGGIGKGDNMVPTSRSFRPGRPVHDATMLTHLKEIKSGLLFPHNNRFSVRAIRFSLAVLTVRWDFCPVNRETN